MYDCKLNSVLVGLRELNDIAGPIQRWLDCQYAAEWIEQRPEDEELIGIVHRRKIDLRDNRKRNRSLMQPDQRAVGDARIIAPRWLDTLVRPFVDVAQACPQRLPVQPARFTTEGFTDRRPGLRLSVGGWTGA